MSVLVGKNTSKILQSVISVEAGDGGSKDMRGKDRSEHNQVGMRAHPPEKVAGQLAQLKCIYMNACSMGNKQEELEAIVQQENYDIVAITETWWEDSHNWSAAIDAYQLWRRDRHGRRGGVPLYVRDRFECLELNNVNDSVECSWVRIKGKANKADIMVGVCYRPPNQDLEIDEIFYKKLAEISQLLALVLVGDFNFPAVCWKYNTAERGGSWSVWKTTS
ncbi:mitochondrial fission process protein 1 [Limosa lapponica baueri]|uniref:Mitochondrial fission process protein 1 n=1 Tax=Limosa lapponica baueri TaxID=1758121 RepID=A0A2I0TR12_LIMLA|nr:mitochondrial fission process protein 1 [Limosa lapponica baueri]